MGDNRDNSSDSRVWGTVDARSHQGQGPHRLVVARAPPTRHWTSVDWFKSIRWNRFFQVVE